MSTPVLDVRGLAFAYPDGHQALFGVDLHVHRGERVALLGPNGAGKTTLLRAVAGLEPLQRGQIELDGRVLDDGAGRLVPPERRGVGLVFQDYRLFPHLSVLDNVAFGARSAGLGRRASRSVAVISSAISVNR